MDEPTPLKRAAQVRRPKPGGYDPAALVVVCDVLKGVHRWADPFSDGDTCQCGALYLDAHPHRGAVYEVQG